MRYAHKPSFRIDLFYLALVCISSRSLRPWFRPDFFFVCSWGFFLSASLSHISSSSLGSTPYRTVLTHSSNLYSGADNARVQLRITVFFAISLSLSSNYSPSPLLHTRTTLSVPDSLSLSFFSFFSFSFSLPRVKFIRQPFPPFFPPLGVFSHSWVSSSSSSSSSSHYYSHHHHSPPFEI
ncbi:hypothetical protein F4775DRAFT_403267 [Biscogniauxia sp. FL1348]|nr:hypothetical protein F4775DRAFT_403267 [Biscogniauxia sp. FL1348]